MVKAGREIVPMSERGDVTTKKPYDLWMDLDRLFDQFRASFDEVFWPFGRRRGAENGSFPLTDVADLGDRYEMYVEMPGIPKDSITVEVSSNTIEISARHEESKEEKDKNWLRRERSNVSFYRSFEFPEQVKTDSVEAELKDGILRITLPKVEPKPIQKARKIAIK